MKAVGFRSPLPIDDPASLSDIDLPRPEPTSRDILVRVEAVSVNPVDTKVRMRAQAEPGPWKVLGWDAAGTIEAVGPEATLFAPGDTVFYAGAIGRPGTRQRPDDRQLHPTSCLSKDHDFAAGLSGARRA